MLKSQQFLSTRNGSVTAPTFWRANACQADPLNQDSCSTLAFSPTGRIGVLGTPIETGLLSVILSGDSRVGEDTVLAGSIDGLADMLCAHHLVGRDDMTWLYVGSGDPCLIHLATPVRSLSGRVVSVRIRPLKTGIGRGGDLKDVAAIYGMDAALILRSAMLHFPRMKPLCHSLPARKPAVA